MSILAVLLIAIGVADLTRTGAGAVGLTARTGRLVGAIVGGLVLILLAALGQLGTARDLALLVVAGLVLISWTWLARVADVVATSSSTSRRAAALALAVPGFGLLVLLAFSAWASTVDGPLRSWLTGLNVAGVRGPNPNHALLVIGAVLVQLATANVAVRLVLAAVGALKPQGQPQAADRLRGGRLLGPMERLLILGLGLAGQVTAAGVVIAAKGLIRWPELQAKSQTSADPGIDEITEYFLVGSFVSWLFALTSLWLAR